MPAFNKDEYEIITVVLLIITGVSFLSLWLTAMTWISAVVGLGSAWWLIEWVKIVEQWRSEWFVSFDRRGSFD